jgi:hypothetical protein
MQFWFGNQLGRWAVRMKDCQPLSGEKACGFFQRITRGIGKIGSENDILVRPARTVLHNEERHLRPAKQSIRGPAQYEMSERLASSDTDCNQVAIFGVGTAQNGFCRLSFGDSHARPGRKRVDIGQEVFSGNIKRI